MKNVFISGGAGFIGSHFVEKLLDDPKIERIMVYDNLCSGTLSRIQPMMVDRRIFFCKGDIRQTDKLRSMMAECDTVIHLAANADISKAAENPSIDFYESTVILQEILEAMRWCGVKNLIYASGSGVYGDNLGIVACDEDYPMLPVSPYGANKVACEALIRAYSAMFGIRATIGRFANVVGPRQTHGVGYDFIRRLKDDPTKLRILGNGTQRKPYIYVDDVVIAMLLVNEKSIHDYDIFNVSTEDYLTVNEIAALAATVSGLSPTAIDFQYTGGSRGWAGDVPVVCLNSAKIRGYGWKETFNSKGAMKASMVAMLKELE